MLKLIPSLDALVGILPFVASPAKPLVSERSCRVGGRRLGYADVLPAGGGPAATVVLLHGWGLTHGSYRRAAQELAGHGFRVLVPDLPGFGRRALPMTPPEIERTVAYQLGAAQALARYADYRISFVKAHGALANLAESDAKIADAIAGAVARVDPALTLLAIARSEQVSAGARAGLRVVEEAFADRAYTEEGRLAPRRDAGAVIEDIAAVVSRVKRMLEAGALLTQGGALLPTPIRSVCVHGDTLQAVAMARALRAALEAEGYSLAPFAPAC